MPNRPLALVERAQEGIKNVADYQADITTLDERKNPALSEFVKCLSLNFPPTASQILLLFFHHEASSNLTSMLQTSIQQLFVRLDAARSSQI